MMTGGEKNLWGNLPQLSYMQFSYKDWLIYWHIQTLREINVYNVWIGWKLLHFGFCFIRSLAVNLFSSSASSFWHLFSLSALYEQNTSISPTGFFNNSGICFSYWTVFTFCQVDVDPAGLSFLAWLLLLISLYQLVSERALKAANENDRKW